MSLIRAGVARSVFDSRGRPTVEVEITTVSAVGRAIAPAGASTGRFEARERRDPDGLGVDDACREFNAAVIPRLIGRDSRDRQAIDQLLIELDGTTDKSRLAEHAHRHLGGICAPWRRSAEPAWQLLAAERQLIAYATAMQRSDPRRRRPRPRRITRTS
jgi:enolase